MGKSIVYLPQCHSTNEVAAEMAQKGKAAEGTLVITDQQTAGKGQRGNRWEASPGLNLTFSIILRPSVLNAREQFLLNETIALGIADHVRTVVDLPVHIKWPNDIMVSALKVCGVLIENHLVGEALAYSVVGIGLNVNQTTFPYPRAASIRMLTGSEYDLNEQLSSLLSCLEARYLALKLGSSKLLRDDYRHHLFQQGVTHRYSADGSAFEGVITGVNEAGQLTLRVGNEEKKYSVREIQFL